MYIFHQVRQEVDVKDLLLRKLASSSDYRLLVGMELLQPTKELTQVPSTTASDNSIPNIGGVPLGHEFGIKQRILQLMYNRHHLLSTKQRQGVLTCNQYVSFDHFFFNYRNAK